MRAVDLDEAIDLANDTPFGLTSGIQSLDDREIDRWLDRIEAGNLYVNRHTTGAIVGRQPFGGWKASSVGPGAKAGGPNYVLQLARWRQVSPPMKGAGCSREVSALLERLADAADDQERALLRTSAASYAEAWQRHFGRQHETSHLLGERNVFRYRPCRRVLVRGDAAVPEARPALSQVLLAAFTCGVPLTVSLPRADPLVPAGRRCRHPDRRGERDRPDPASSLIGWHRAAPYARARLARCPVGGSRGGRGDHRRTGRGHRSTRAALVLREQTISRVTHRYGNVVEPPQ